MEIFDKPNPILEQEDYAKGYKESIEQNRMTPELIEYDKLCYELFHMNEQGKRFLELAIDRFVIPAKCNPSSPTYMVENTWWEGFKHPFREIRQGILSHQQRIKAGTN